MAGDAELLRRGPRPCKVQGCDNLAITRADLCATHRRRKQLYGDTDGTYATHKKCMKCGAPAVAAHRSSDWCAEHYVDFVKALVVAGDASVTITRNSAGYEYVSIFKKNLAVHRIVMEAKLGRPLMAGENVHHVNAVRHDNRPENLELWVKPQPRGMRVADLVEWVVSAYPAMVREAIDKT